jgi:hypothetical protein
MRTVRNISLVVLAAVGIMSSRKQVLADWGSWTGGVYTGWTWVGGCENTGAACSPSGWLHSSCVNGQCLGVSSARLEQCSVYGTYTGNQDSPNCSAYCSCHVI